MQEVLGEDQQHHARGALVPGHGTLAAGVEVSQMILDSPEMIRGVPKQEA